MRSRPKRRSILFPPPRKSPASSRSSATDRANVGSNRCARMAASTFPWHRTSSWETTTRGTPLPYIGKLTAAERREATGAKSRRGWQLLSARFLIWNWGVSHGAWKTDGEGRLCICGSIRPAQAAPEQPVSTQDSNCLYRQFPAFVQKRLKPYQIEGLTNMPPERQLAFLQKLIKKVAAELNSQAEVVAAIRLITGPDQDTTYSEFGIRKSL
jgi:hypothetical protein